jgi:glutathione peroxidase
MIDRRQILALLGSSFCSPALAQVPAMSRLTAYAFSFDGLDGGSLRLAEHAGKPILIVNTASLCGYTPQYAGLQDLWKRYRDRGLVIIGVPSNDFGGQEPGGAPEINKTAHDDYGVSFPLAAKAEGRPRTRSTNGPRLSAPAKVRDGTFTNIWWVATAFSPPCSRHKPSQRIRA